MPIAKPIEPVTIAQKDIKLINTTLVELGEPINISKMRYEYKKYIVAIQKDIDAIIAGINIVTFSIHLNISFINKNNITKGTASITNIKKEICLKSSISNICGIINPMVTVMLNIIF